jgi:hypothetical protein
VLSDSDIEPLDAYEYDQKRRALLQKIRGAQAAIATATDPNYTRLTENGVHLVYAMMDSYQASLKSLDDQWKSQQRKRKSK